ncbi:MAG: anaerobic ribonucleoside-triphosphate reductase activating protein [Clostridia bacterium]|nr:anaerobic ribonucleoside-triphosphate reductase activating protein [Clostridia bacterium]
MNIQGFQKMTLLDYPQRVACTVFTGGCNFRCPFCHNASLVTDINLKSAFSEDEILDFLKKRQGVLDGVCITGGEPLLQPDIKQFIIKIKSLGYKVKLDTNGSFPEKLKELIDEKLIDYVAMDIKNAKEKYPITAGITKDIMPSIEKSVKILLENRVEYEFRTTVTAQHHTVEDIENIAKWINGAKKYFLQGFVDSGEILGEDSLSAPDEKELKDMEKTANNYILTHIRGVK